MIMRANTEADSDVQRPGWSRDAPFIINTDSKGITRINNKIIVQEVRNAVIKSMTDSLDIQPV
jgi:hypothetical protein